MKFIGLRETQIYTTKQYFKAIQHNHDMAERATYDHVDVEKLHKEHVILDNNNVVADLASGVNMDDNLLSNVYVLGSSTNKKQIKSGWVEFRKQNKKPTFYETYGKNIRRIKTLEGKDQLSSNQKEELLDLKLADIPTSQEYNYENNVELYSKYKATLSDEDQKSFIRYDDIRQKKIGFEQVIYFSNSFNWEENFDQEAESALVENWNNDYGNKHGTLTGAVFHRSETSPHCHLLFHLFDKNGNLKTHNQKAKKYLSTLQTDIKAAFDKTVKENNIVLEFKYNRGISKLDADGNIKEDWQNVEHADFKEFNSFKQSNDMTEILSYDMESIQDMTPKQIETFKRKIAKLRKNTPADTKENKLIRNLLTHIGRSIYYDGDVAPIIKKAKKLGKIEDVLTSDTILELKEYGIYTLIKELQNSETSPEDHDFGKTNKVKKKKNNGIKR